MGVDFNLSGTGFAVKLGFVIFFNAKLADLIGSCVVVDESVFSQLLNICLIDAGDIAYSMGYDICKRVVALKCGLNLHIRKAEAVYRELGYLLLREHVRNFNAGELLTGSCFTG